MTTRTQSVVDLLGVAGDANARKLATRLESVLGKVVSLAPLVLLADVAGVVVTDAAAAPGTDVPEVRSVVNFGDAGIDQVRLVARAKNSAAGSVAVQAYRVTGSTTIASVTVTDGTLATFQGTWTVLRPTGRDEEIGVRVVGDGAFDPTLYRIELQMRTLRKAS